MIDTEKVQAKIKKINADSGGKIKHYLEAWVFADYLEFAIMTEEETEKGTVFGPLVQFDTEQELNEWIGSD